MRIFLIGLLTATMLAGCSDKNEPTPIDVDAAATDAGLTKDEYTVHDNGAIEVHAPDSKNTASTPADGPLATQGDSWQYVLNNALRTADEYATAHNPKATFIGNDVSANLVKQYGGEYEGQYLLTVLNDQGDSVSYAQLLPKFDVNQPSDSLDDEGELWEVVIAKYNGQEF